MFYNNILVSLYYDLARTFPIIPESFRAFPSISELLQAFILVLANTRACVPKLCELRYIWSRKFAVLQLRYTFLSERHHLLATNRTRIAFRHFNTSSSMSFLFLLASRKPLFLVISSPTDILTHHFIKFFRYRTILHFLLLFLFGNTRFHSRSL